MPDYSKGKIYKIVSDSIEGTYYGSSVNTLSKRLSNHINKYKLWKKGKKEYMTSFKLLETNDYHIILVENYKCNNKEELKARERYYIENNECVNKIIPGRTKKEWCEDNKEKIRKQNKEYRETNIERIREYRETHKEQKQEYDNEYREKNKEKIKEYKKDYYEKNKENLKAIKKEYYETNKKKILEKYICVCNGEEYNKQHKARHERSPYHKKNYQIIKEICKKNNVKI